MKKTGLILLGTVLFACGQYDKNLLATFTPNAVADGGEHNDAADAAEQNSDTDAGTTDAQEAAQDMGLRFDAELADAIADAGHDAEMMDTGFPPDAIVDAGFSEETGPRDTGLSRDADPVDIGFAEDARAAPMDAGFPADAVADAGFPPDAMPIDGGHPPDAGFADAGTTDAGVQQCTPPSGWICIPPTGPQGFRMGAGVPGENEHTVVITRPFWIGETEVTQAEWRALGGGSPSAFANCGADCPVESISFSDMIGFLNNLSTSSAYDQCYLVNGQVIEWTGADPLSCNGFRLCTEAEWEYAGRANGSTWWQPLDPVAWYEVNSSLQTHPVSTLAPNPVGLRHMLGNVRELVWGQVMIYPTTTQTDPIYGGTVAGSTWSSVIRGGAFDNNAAVLHPGRRGSCQRPCTNRGTGLRICRTATP